MSVLAPDDAEDLVAIGLASPASSNGTRRVHKRRLNRSSDEENSHLPLTPISPGPSTPDPEKYATIPDTLVSLATLKYLGYTDTTANEIWTRWTNWPSGQPGRFEVDLDGEILFIDVATSYLTRGREHDTWDDNDQPWYNCMSLCGIRPEVQVSIMDPVFKRIRLTESCYFWMKDTIELRYRGLEAAQRASRERAMFLQRAASRPNPITIGGSRGLRSTISSTMRMAPEISPVSNSLIAQNAPGFTTLYKGLDQARVDGLFNNWGDVVAWQRLLSNFPSDFLGRDAGFYFAVHRDIAEYYACYAKRRDDVSSVVVIHLTIPNNKIESLSTTQLQKTYWPSAEWKNLVWHCRTARRLPTELRKFKQACLIIGTMAKKPNTAYDKMNSPEQIDESCVLKTKDGGNAVQYVFHNDEGEQFLEQQVSSVSVHPVTNDPNCT
ncbi:hypothetical protein V8E54_008691 [Elaphomyces granulatus]